MIGHFSPASVAYLLPSGPDRNNFRINSDTKNAGDVIMKINEAAESGAVLNLEYNSAPVPQSDGNRHSCSN